MCVHAELLGREASTSCNRSEKRYTHAVTWVHMHTNSKAAHLQINSSIAYSHSCSISYWQTAGEKHLHTLFLSVNTSLRLVGGKHSPASDFSLDHVQRSGRNVLIASAFIHTHNLTLPSCLTNRTLVFFFFMRCTCKCILLTVIICSNHLGNTSEKWMRRVWLCSWWNWHCVCERRERERESGE